MSRPPPRVLIFVISGAPNFSSIGSKVLAHGKTMRYVVPVAATVDKKARCAAMSPVTTLAEPHIASEVERADMIASLKAAEARIAEGEFVERDPETFVDRFMLVRDAAVRSKKA